MTRRPRVGTEAEERPDRRRERVEAFVHELVVALLNAELHAPTSAAARTQLDAAVVALGSALAAGASAPLRVEARGNALAWDGAALLGASLQAGKLLRLLHDRKVAALTFDATVDADALGRVVELLDDRRSRDAFRPAVLDTVLRARGIQGISIELGAPPSAAPTPQSAVTGDSGGALESYQQLAEALQESHVAASRGADLEIDLAKGLVERTVAQMGAAPSDLLALAVYDDVDRFTVGHSVRVALLALEVARAAGASPDQLLLVGTAGLLHDIGKSLVPQEVLFKQGALDDDEWRAMTEHPRLGAQILVEQRDVHPSAIGAAFCHHMAPKGGYPDPLARFEPSGISRLIRVCDVFEALTAVRPYKRELSPLEAMALMNRDTGNFDRRWLQFFFRTVGIYPIGSRLRLDTGENGLVVRHGPTCEQPVVRLLTGPDGAPLPDDAATRDVVVGVPDDGTVRVVAAVLRRRAGAEIEDSSARAVAPIQHACLGPQHPHDDSCPHG